ncbi:fungal-specific transcription factor domain-containing protein [Ilyonectria sp. MPI-CAGE-AT-0026]|nr:fungal-specific transcription factor domain-containing protein [Ilyonectria sp. MPI-CAGE-AT-0026]
MQNTKNKARSHNGCERCRKRRQKCNEELPTCKRCHDAETPCVYALNVRWGGRSFSRSRFRHCQVHKLEVSSGGFVYSGSQPSVADIPNTTNINSGRIHGTPSMSTGLSSLHLTLGQFPNVESKLLPLLDYFVHVGSLSMCTHQQSRLETCQALIPMSQTIPSLLSAILSYSAAHRMADHSQSTQPNDKILAASLKLESIQQLRREVGSSASPPEGTLATSLMLLQCIAAYQDDDFASWRLFLHGARTALAVTMGSRSRLAETRSSSSLRYLRDRYQLFELIAMLSPGGFHAYDAIEDELPDPEGDATAATPGLNIFLDKYGCSTDVRRLLRNISALAWEHRRLTNSNESTLPTSMLSFLDVHQEATSLETELVSMIERDNQFRPLFVPSILNMLTEDQVFEFITCNQIYEYMLLTFLRTEVMGMPTARDEVQKLIREIIRLTSLLEPSRGLSPSTGLNTALFIAGRHALPDDRPAIMSLLSYFFSRTLNYNMVRAQIELMRYWSLVPSSARLLPGQDATDFLAF